eukprot:439084_1
MEPHLVQSNTTDVKEENKLQPAKCDSNTYTDVQQHQLDTGNGHKGGMFQQQMRNAMQRHESSIQQPQIQQEKEKLHATQSDDFTQQPQGGMFGQQLMQGGQQTGMFGQPLMQGGEQGGMFGMQGRQQGGMFGPQGGLFGQPLMQGRQQGGQQGGIFGTQGGMFGQQGLAQLEAVHKVDNKVDNKVMLNVKRHHNPNQR